MFDAYDYEDAAYNSAADDAREIATGLPARPGVIR